MRGRTRLIDLCDDYLQGSGPSAQVIAKMKLGHEMLVDLRARTEFRAYYTGEYDDVGINLGRRFIRQGGCALDVGANVGFWSVPLARTCAEARGHLFAFEPVPRNADRLEDNLRRNGVLGSATVERLGLSSVEAEAVITLREDFERGAGTGNASVLVADGLDDRFATVRTRLITLDGYLSSRPTIRLDFVKVDIEGHEDLFLQGAAATIREMRPVIYAEWNVGMFQRRGVDPTSAVSDQFDGLDYTFHRRQTDGTWLRLDRFESPLPLDDILIAPADRLSVLTAASA